MTIGFVELLKSKKGTLALLVLACSTIVAALGHLDGTAFAAAMSVIYTIFSYTSHKVEIASIHSASKTDVASIQSGKAPDPTNIP